jgi:hypothetical protein
MTKLDEHFIKIGACEPGRTWVAAHCTKAQQCWESLAKKQHIGWMLWWLCVDGAAAPTAAELARRWALRTARVHAANACEKAGILDHAAALRTLPDDATCEQIELAARGAAAWAARDAAWDAAWAASWAAQAAAWAARDAARAAWASGAAARAAARDAAWASGAAARAAALAAGAAGAAAGAAAELDQQIAEILFLQPSAPWTESAT